MWWIGVSVSIYMIFAVAVFILEAAAGPVTLGLAAERGAVWPIFLATGRPAGQRARMD